MNRETFIFHTDWHKAMEGLDDSVKLELFQAIVEYATKKNIISLSPIAQIAFNFIKLDIERDLAKYEAATERNRINGAKGGRPVKDKEENPNNPVGFSETQKTEGFSENPKNPKNLDNDYDNDSDSDNDINNNIINNNTIVKKESNCSQEFIDFENWVKANAPAVARMKHPITEAQFNKIKVYSAKLVADVLLAMENYKELNKKYTSAYLTLTSWIKKRLEGGKPEVSNVAKIASVMNEVNRRDEQRKNSGIQIISMFDGTV